MTMLQASGLLFSFVFYIYPPVPDTEPEEALKLMLGNNFRHIPLSEDGATVCGMLSLRKVLSYIVEDQRDNLNQMEVYLNADGPGG